MLKAIRGITHLGKMNYTARVLVAILLAGAMIVLWQIRQVVLLVFGGLIVAAIVTAAARTLTTLTGVKRRLAVLLAVLLLVLGLAAAFWLLGGAIAAQFDDLRERVPVALRNVREWLVLHGPGRSLVDLWDDVTAAGVPWARIASAAGLTLGAVATLVLMMIIGIFFAAASTYIAPALSACCRCGFGRWETKPCGVARTPRGSG